jgi:hypothetical protein
MNRYYTFKPLKTRQSQIIFYFIPSMSRQSRGVTNNNQQST